MSFVTVLLAVSRVRVETILGFKIQISGAGSWPRLAPSHITRVVGATSFTMSRDESTFRLDAGCLIEVGRTSSFNFAIQRNRFRSYLGRMNGSALLFGSVIYTTS